MKRIGPLVFLFFFQNIFQICGQTIVNVADSYACFDSICYSVSGLNFSTVTLSGSAAPSWTVTAVGCINTFNLNIWINSQSALKQGYTISDLQLCKDSTCGYSKGPGIGTVWSRGEAFARSCCMHESLKRNILCDPDENYVNLPLDTFACTIFNASAVKSASAPYYMTATVNYIPPLTSDINNAGQNELCFCFGSSCPAVMPPICIQFKVCELQKISTQCHTRPYDSPQQNVQ